jgi:hypothetical protein
MAWFQLDPEGLAARARIAGVAAPTLGASLLRGTLGFTAVSVAGFAPWALLGGFFHRVVGEAGMYIACALVFIGLSGLLLHKLIIGPGSLPRFYKLFSITFALYSIAWIVAWMSIGGHTGSIVGLFAGTLVMGGLFALAFEAGLVAAIGSVVALFALNSAGYFFGGVVEHDIATMKEMSLLGIQLDKRQTFTVAMLSWGVFYGLGLGAGLALAFYFCQAKARALLKS